MHAAVGAIELPAGVWNLTPIGALIGVLVVAYWLIASGRLVPRSSHERELSKLETAHALVLAAEVRRGDEWKETALDQRKVNQEIRAQNTTLLEAVRTSSHFFAAVTPEVSDVA